MDRLRRLVPVDLRVVLLLDALVGGALCGLGDPRSLPFRYQADRIHSALHPLREQEPLVDGADGVIGLYITLPLEQDWSGVQSVVSPEHGEPALLVPVDQGPVDGGGPPVAWQQRGVVDDGAVLGVVDNLHGDELGAERQHVELGARGLVLGHHLRQRLALQAPAGKLEDRHIVPLCLDGQWVGLAVLVRDGEDADDGVAILPQLLVDLLTKKALANHSNPHVGINVPCSAEPI